MDLLEKFALKHPKAILVWVTILVYFNSLFNGFVGDDFDQIVKNGLVHSIFNIPRFFLGGTFFNGFSNQAGIYYKPVLSSLFALIYSVSFNSSFTFRLVQIAFHAGNGILIFYLFKKIFNSRKIAFFVSLIFLIHPINAESVLYISALQDVSFMFFGLLALSFASKKALTLKSWLVICLLLILSILCKETGILFFPLIIAFRLLFISKEKLKNLAAFEGATLLIYAFLRIATVGVYRTQNEIYPFLNLSLYQRLLNIPELFYRYLVLFFFPKDLAFTQNWVVTAISLQKFYLPLIISLAFLALAALLGFSLRKDKSSLKIYCFFAAWFLAGMLMHLQIIPLDMTLAERWMYFPLLGLLGMLAVLYPSVASLCQDDNKKKLGLVILSAVSVIFGVRTFVRTFDWRDQYTLYSHDVSVRGDSFNLQNGLATELMNRGDYRDAKVHIEQSIALKGDYCYSWNNLGLIDLQDKNYPKARDSFQKAINNGGCYLAYENMGTFLYFHDTPKSAESFMTGAVKILPADARLYFMLSLAESKLGEKDKAIEAIKRSNQIAPTSGTVFVYQKLMNNEPIDLRE